MAASLLGEKFEPSDEIESESVSSRVDEGLLFSRETRFFDRRSHSSLLLGPVCRLRPSVAWRETRDVPE
jgi:hypothetical protein